MSAADVTKAFGRIVDWANRHAEAKAILPSLRGPATEADIAAFEKRAKVKLPEGLAAVYRLHDGQDEGAANDALEGDSIESGLFPSLESDDLAFLLVPLKELGRNCKGGMPGFRKGWIPFGDNYGGDNIVLDMAETTPAEKRGRVMQFNHEYGGATELAESFEAYLVELAEGLAKGSVVWDAECGFSYKEGRDWDELIDEGLVEYEEEEDE